MASINVTLNADIQIPANVSREEANNIATNLQFYLDWSKFLIEYPDCKLDGITIEEPEQYDDDSRTFDPDALDDDDDYDDDYDDDEITDDEAMEDYGTIIIKGDGSTPRRSDYEASRDTLR